MTGHAPPRSALRRLLAPGARLWLVRSCAGEEATAFSIFLLHAVPGLLDTLGAEVAGHG